MKDKISISSQEAEETHAACIRKVNDFLSGGLPRANVMANFTVKISSSVNSTIVILLLVAFNMFWWGKVTRKGDSQFFSFEITFPGAPVGCEGQRAALCIHTSYKDCHRLNVVELISLLLFFIVTRLTHNILYVTVPQF